MKKFILSLVGVLAVVTAQAYTVSIQVQPNTLTNLFASYGGPTNGAFVLTSVIITANNTNSTVAFVDTPNGSYTNYTAAYTNRISYATNYVTTWTNFYGVVQSTTNVSLIDVNQTVGALTNTYPTVLSAGAAAGTSTTLSGRYVFQNGVFLTNTSAAGYPGLPTITATFTTP